jgi:thiazole synthase
MEGRAAAGGSRLNPLFRVAGLEMTRIWHCFGNYTHRVDLWTIQRMLRASRTNVLPINTHRLSAASRRDGLEIGFGGVTVDQLRETRSLDGMVSMLNINHQTTAAAAVAKTSLAYELTGEPVVKLEVLNGDLRTSNDAQLIEAVRELRRALPQLIVMPLVSNDWTSAERLVDLGCPLLRVMGSAIGSGRGIADVDTFARVCTLPVPVVLDGGVARSSDFAVARAAGAQGCLINSALFAGTAPPDVALRAFVRACAPVFAEKHDRSSTAPSSFSLASSGAPAKGTA